MQLCSLIYSQNIHDIISDQSWRWWLKIRSTFQKDTSLVPSLTTSAYWLFWTDLFLIQWRITSQYCRVFLSGSNSCSPVSSGDWMGLIAASTSLWSYVLSLSGCSMRVLLHGGSWARKPKNRGGLKGNECVLHQSRIFYSPKGGGGSHSITFLCPSVLNVLTESENQRKTVHMQLYGRTVSAGQIYWDNDNDSEMNSILWKWPSSHWKTWDILHSRYPIKKSTEIWKPILVDLTLAPGGMLYIHIWELSILYFGIFFFAISVTNCSITVSV